MFYQNIKAILLVNIFVRDGKNIFVEEIFYEVLRESAESFEDEECSN